MNNGEKMLCDLMKVSQSKSYTKNYFTVLSISQEAADSIDMDKFSEAEERFLKEQREPYLRFVAEVNNDRLGIWKQINLRPFLDWALAIFVILYILGVI